MDCPFVLPLKRVKSNINTYYVVEIKNGVEHEIAIDVTKIQADYLVNAINRFEELLTAYQTVRADVA